MANGGSILTLTYLGSTRVVQNYNVMGVAKAALEARVRYLAADLGPKNIRVNAISAGPIKTASARGIKDFSKVLDGVAAIAPLRRNTDPAEVADAAVFLASDLGRGVTANVLYRRLRISVGCHRAQLTMLAAATSKLTGHPHGHYSVVFEALSARERTSGFRCCARVEHSCALDVPGKYI